MSPLPNYSNTRFKLNEARWFLDKMNEMQSDVELYLYYLSAHLTAAISVFDVMKYEFNHPKKQEFADWFEPRFADLEQHGFAEFNCLRISVVHLAGNLANRVKKSDGGKVVMHSGSVSITRIDSQPISRTMKETPMLDMPSFDKVDGTMVWQFIGKNEPIAVTCERFYLLISKMVEDCEFKFYR